MKLEYYTSRKSASYYNRLNTGEYAISEDFLVLLGALTQQGIYTKRALHLLTAI